MTPENENHTESTRGVLRVVRNDLPAFRPAIDNRAIFEELINSELRNGRLTPSRRRRIVRYAARLEMTPVQAGRMISRVRDELANSSNPTHQQHALRLAPPLEGTDRRKMRLLLKLILIADLCAIGWLVFG